MQLIRSLIVAILVICSFAAQAAEAPSREWGGYKGLEASGPRLTLLVYSFLFESYLQELDKNPDFYKHLLGATSISVSERRVGLEEMFGFWATQIEESERLVDREQSAPLSSKAILAKWSDPKRDAGFKALLIVKRLAFTRMMLREGFGDATSHALELVHRLEGERDLSSRLKSLAIAAAAMARDESSLVAAGSIANLLTQISTDPSVNEDLRKGLRPTALKLSGQVRQAAVDFSKIDLLSPENLIGGGVFFRLAGPILVRSAGWRLLKSAWTASSGLQKATAVSVTGHAVVLGALSQKSEMPKANELVDASKAAAARSRVVGQNIGALAAQAVAKAASKSDAVSIDAAHNLAEAIIYSKTDSVAAMKYADLFAAGERVLPREEIRHLARKGATSRGYIQNRDDVVRRFDRYMVSRRLTIADADAIAVLRGYVDLYLGPHEENQSFATVAAMSSRNGGNCVARAMNFTAFFYPAYRKYENPKLRFGLMNWTNHVEAVLYSREADAVMALYPMRVIDRQADKAGAPAVVDARQFAASFLYREKSASLWEHAANHLKPYDLFPRSRFEIRKLNATSTPSPFASQDLTSATQDLDPNPNPFVTARYGDAFTIPQGERAQMNTSALKRRFDRLDATKAMKELLENKVSEARATSTRSSGRVTLDGIPHGAEGTHSIYLSETEIGSVVGTRKLSPFGILTSSGGIQIPVLNRDFGVHDTPYRTPEAFYDEVVKRVREFQSNPKWKELVAGQMQNLDQLGEDPSFTIALAEFTHLVYAVMPDVRNNRWYYGNYSGDFFSLLSNRFGAMAVDDEMLKANRNIDLILRPYAVDSSGLKLAQYLNSAKSLPFGQQVRKFQALRAAMTMASEESVTGLNRQMSAFEFQLVKQNSEPTANKAESSPKLVWDQKMMIVLSNPTPASAVATSRSARPVARLVLDVPAAFLYVHYNLSEMDQEKAREILNAVGAGDVKQRTFEIAEKFLNWAPLADQADSFQGRLASEWGGSHTSMCRSLNMANAACDTVDDVAGLVSPEEVMMDAKPTPLD